ncbi:hypothetical protein [Nocardioides convexus]|uniref:hypothetical protein n=1 Tax=Nocardioides convexus TaxID=2712224 RepID=UPI002418A882|nr:hypothetical protein [Nocardioides convexus]
MPSEEFLTGPAALAAIEAVSAAAAAADGAAPLDEAALLRLRHHGLAGAESWVSTDGFALRRGTEPGPGRRAGRARRRARWAAGRPRGRGAR